MPIPKAIRDNCAGAIVVLKNDTTGEQMETMLLGRGPYGAYLKHLNAGSVFRGQFIDAGDWTVFSVLPHRPSIGGLCRLTDSGRERCGTEGGTPSRYLRMQWVVTHHHVDDPALLFAVPQCSADYAHGQWFHVDDVRTVFSSDMIAAEYVRNELANLVS
jgi:hypothetical protein